MTEDGPGNESAAFMRKAERACESARPLLDAGDADGACNRAYYAMFDAARAATLDQMDARDDGPPRTHRGVLRRFSEKLVIPEHVSLEAGRALRRAETLRSLADYRDRSVGQDDARFAVEQAEAFMKEVTRYLDGSRMAGDGSDGYV